MNRKIFLALFLVLGFVLPLFIQPINVIATPPADYVSYWNMNEGSGSTITDSSSNHNDGTGYYTAWDTGVLSNALRFDGSSSYASFGNTGSLNLQTVSVSVWVKFNAFSSYARIIERGGYSTGTGYGLICNDGYVIFEHNSGSGDYEAVTSNLLSTDTWYHIVGVFDDSGDTAKIYINNVLNASETWSYQTISASVYPFVMGKRATGSDSYLNGVLDEFYVYDYALDTDDVEDLYKILSVTMSIQGGVGGTIVPDVGVHYYGYGETVTIEATAGEGYFFSTWLFNGQTPIGNNPFQFTIHHNNIIVASFLKLTVFLTISPSEHGYLDPTEGETEFPYGTQVSITAYPNASYYLFNWVINGGTSNALLGINPLNFTITQNMTIYALFTTTIYHTVTVLSTDNGEYNLNPIDYYVVEGNSFSITAIPDYNYKLFVWYINGSTSSYTSDTLTITINGDTTVKAYFVSTLIIPEPETSFWTSLIITLLPTILLTGIMGFVGNLVVTSSGFETRYGWVGGGLIGLFICGYSGLVDAIYPTIVIFATIVLIYYYEKRG